MTHQGTQLGRPVPGRERLSGIMGQQNDSYSTRSQHIWNCNAAHLATETLTSQQTAKLRRRRIELPILVWIVMALVMGVNGCGEVQIKTHARQVEANPIHMSVAIVLPESYKANVDRHVISCLPLVVDVSSGREFGEGMIRALDRLFPLITVIRDRSKGIGRFDLLLEPGLPTFKVEGHCAHATALAGATYGFTALFIKKYVETSGEFQVRVSDKTGNVLLDRSYRSGIHTRRFEVLQDARRFVGETVGDALSDLFADLVLDLASSQMIHAHMPSAAMALSEPAPESAEHPKRGSDVDAPLDVKAKTVPHKHALIIGIEKYRGALPKASFGDHDASMMSEYLTSLMGYSQENIVLLTNEHATKSDLEKYVEGWLPNRVRKDDSVFVYFSGHGAPHPKEREAYLVPYDGDPVFLDKTGYPLKRLYEHLGKLPAKEIIVVLDACFSGAGNRSVIASGMRPMVLSVENPLLASGNTLVLTAGAGDQLSSTYMDKNHGLLTYFFLKGLRGEADRDHNRAIDLAELFDYLKPQVESVARREFNNEQIPQLLGSPDILKHGVTLIEQPIP